MKQNHPPQRRNRESDKAASAPFRKDKKSFDKDSSDRPKRPYQKREEGSADRPKRAFVKRDGDASGSDKPRRSFDKSSSDRPKRPYQKREEGGSSYAKSPRSFSKDGADRPKRAFVKRDGDASGFDKPRRSFDKDSSDRPKRPYQKREEGGADRPKRAFVKRDGDASGFDKPRRSFDKDSSDRPKRPYQKREEGGADRPKRSFDKSSSDRPRKTYAKRDGDATDFNKPRRSFDKKSSEKSFDKPKRNFAKRDDDSNEAFDKPRKTFRRDDEKSDKKKYEPGVKKLYNAKDSDLIRLNKYISNAGICSRREADDLIKSGCITVNGEAITELGFKVKTTDKITYSGAAVKTEKHVYLLLNKPKDYITTLADERGRRTVMELVASACKERIYPVGRLDRNTTGLLLFTNDGDMAKKLTHPKHEIQKLYHVELDKNLKQDDFAQIQEGLELEDGFIKPDEVSYTGASKREVGIQIHSGKNRVVRRMFEHLEYDVVKLDRVMFAGLTKKDIARGRWRFLTDKEIAFLKMV